MERIDFWKLHVRGEEVRLENGGYEVDFGGIAKGYGVDAAIRDLQSKGTRSALLEAGGDLYALGRPAADRRWTIGVRDPLDPTAIFATLEVEDEAVATSGIYAQTRTQGAQSVSHIIDPRTGQSVQHTLSVTIVAKEAMTADALATAACVLPPAQAKALIEETPDAEALWVFADKSVYTTRGLRRRVTLA